MPASILASSSQGPSQGPSQEGYLTPIADLALGSRISLVDIEAQAVVYSLQRKEWPYETQWTLGLPSGAYVGEGTDLVVKWNPEDRTDTFRLTLETFLTTPIIMKDGMNDVWNFEQIYHVLNEQVNFTDGSFTWPVEVIDSREGETYLYTFSTAYDYQNGHYTSYSGTLNFHVQAS
ncbi:hypothetical protein F4820DRAFT_445040 [Hypoxylon rubiginosum]|uniref:Uncharacterized protein n=1 Tax=Hypoxylon rubiginosum TaxID=110542 RepID=A0ACB9ZA47_9PEZI|nr:hypothetical protein F4820DRAFT_445040 [Hypoxylon rubiginosum]